MNITSHHARYFAHDLTRRGGEGLDRLSMALYNASVDLNPHQIEAALFALKSPLSKGVILADELGLGKTIEAGIVLCQFWAERKRRLLVICPASLRKQWAAELEEKFNLPSRVLDARAYRLAERDGRAPFGSGEVVIMSFNYANRMREELALIDWDLAVIDEAHKLRNAYRPSNRVGQGIRWALEDTRKLLLTATPLQNSLLELYGLSTLIDEQLFGDIDAFRARYTGAGADLAGLRERLVGFTKRTLRKEVTEYVPYTERRAITRPFVPSNDEHQLYEAVSAFLQRDESYAIPYRQRHLTVLILRKLLASSTNAIAGTLEAMKARLEALREDQLQNDPAFAEALIESEDIEEDLLDEMLDDILDEQEQVEEEEPRIDPLRLKEEIATLDRLARWARGIKVDAKTKALLSALDVGFEQMEGMGAERKALIFTESRRTQDYLKAYLEANGYAGGVIAFNGTNSGPETTAIYESWKQKHAGSSRVTGSRAVDVRTALIEHFRDESPIMIATEAGAEGINLQFCSLVVNYDLPWNPQRIEQRIGRCHRYGQKHDVVVINFLNERNAADRRVLELLMQKFSLFDGVFGASDEVLGTIESGVDFEKRILAIYQQCRTTEEIEAAFLNLQEELDEQIRSRMLDTRRILLEHFDEDVHARLRLRLEDARASLDRFGRRFWEVTRFMLDGKARFDEDDLTFVLDEPPLPNIPIGRYALKSRMQPPPGDGAPATHREDAILYRLSHPLGEHVVSQAAMLSTPPVHLTFDITNHPTRILVVEALKGRSGYLALTRLAVDSYEREEYLLFSGFDDDGQMLDQETSEKLFQCMAQTRSGEIPTAVSERLDAEMERHVQATLSRSLEQNNRYFGEAREKLDRWADDLVLAAEKALRDTKQKIKVARREARQASTMEEQHAAQESLRKLERLQRRQRQEVFDAEDEIMERRDALIDALEKRMAQRTVTERVFTIRWSVV